VGLASRLSNCFTSSELPDALFQKVVCSLNFATASQPGPWSTDHEVFRLNLACYTTCKHYRCRI
jgi:hypothetical protein